MEPRVNKGSSKLQLSYLLPHRIHCAQISPVSAPNGSSVIIYGYDRGIRVVWSGGKRRRRQTYRNHNSNRHPSQPNGTSKTNDVIILDDDNEDDEANGSSQFHSGKLDEFEDEEDEVDPDSPFQNIVENIDIDLDAAVLHLSVPSPTSLPRTPSLLRNKLLVAVACSDGRLLLLTIPLTPPTDSDQLEWSRRVLESTLSLPNPHSICRSLCGKFFETSEDEVERSKADVEGEAASASLLLVGVSESVKIARIWLFDNHFAISDESVSVTCLLETVATQVSFHPAPKSTQLLISDSSGATRIFDPKSSVTQNRPSSRDSESSSANVTSQGGYIMSYYNPRMPGPPVFARSKQTLASDWILNGRAILVLLEDGEWGIWDVSMFAQSDRNTSEFLLHGFLGSSLVTDASDVGKPRKGTRLAPMTPNTRKVKAENLFTGPKRANNAASTGGISVAPASTLRGQTDESIYMWYNGDIYTISSSQKFWQRSTSSTNGSSLRSPSLAQISDINLMNENITSISQFAIKQSATTTGQVHAPRDIVLSAEHRLIVTQSLRPTAPPKALFQQVPERSVPRPTSHDQRMLDAGELDVGGMDRLLDNMAHTDARPRRVGFASS